VKQSKKPAKIKTLTPVPSSDAAGLEEDVDAKAEVNGRGSIDGKEGGPDDNVSAGLPSPATSPANGVVGKQVAETASQTPSRRVR
jgi:hypothetical protein